MAASYAWGIDIGNRALKAVRLSNTGEGLRIDDFDVIEHEQILSNAGDNRESLVISALANFVQRHELKGAPVAIGVSGQSSFARFIKLPPVEPRKIPEIVRFEAIQQIPFPLDEVEWSYQLFQDPQSPDVEVGIFAMRKELVNQHIKYFTDSGLNVQAVQMNPLAVYNGMYHDDRIKGTTMIVDVGAENTDLIIAEGQTIWLRSIPIGGNNFTESLVKAFKLKFPKAEELKRNAATSKYGRQILQAMKPVFNDLVGEIQRSIGFYASVHRESRIARVLALGGTFRLPGLQKYVQQNLQIDVHRIDRLGAGAPPDARAATVFSENILSSVGAYGLAIQGLGLGKINSSLLPMRIRREKMWREKTKWFAAAAAMFVAVPLIGVTAIKIGEHNLDATAQVDSQNRTVLTQAKNLSDEWDSKVESAGAPDRQRTNNILSLVQGRQTQPALIADIFSCLPTPDPAILKASKENVAQLPKRGDRGIIQIDRITMDYHDDMASFLAMKDDELGQIAIAGPPSADVGGGAAGGGRNSFMNNPRLMGRFRGRGMPTPQQPTTPTNPEEANAAAAPKQRGFVIEVICTTPNSLGPSYVLDTFVTNLRKRTPNAPNPPVGYSIVRAAEPSSVKLGTTMQDQVSPAASFNSSSGLRGYGGARGYSNNPRQNFRQFTEPPTTGPAPEQYNPMQDPATGEDMSNDTQATVRMLVILDPPPPTTQPAAAGQVAQSNP